MDASIHAWREADFEQFFLRHPVLPGGERVMIVARQRALRRIVDILAIDAEGGLVLVEVKNEAATRTVIGQAFEYLARYDGITSDDLSDEYRAEKNSLATDFADCFGRPLAGVSDRRRVLIVAPSFNAHCDLGVRFVSKCLAGTPISFGLLRATRTSKGFEVAPHECPPLLPPAKLDRQFATTIGGRLVFVLDGAGPAVVWRIGKRRMDGRLRLPSGKAMTARAARFSSGLLLPTPVPHDVEVPPRDEDAWEHRKRTGRAAKLLGVIRGGTRAKGRRRDHACYALYDGGLFRGFRIRGHDSFVRDWQRSAAPALPSWRQTAKLADEALQRAKQRRNG